MLIKRFTLDLKNLKTDSEDLTWATNSSVDEFWMPEWSLWQTHFFESIWVNPKRPESVRNRVFDSSG